MSCGSSSAISRRSRSAKEGVDAEPPVPATRLHEQEVRARDPVELSARVVRLQDGVAERPRQLAEKRGPAQKAQISRVEVRDVLGAEIVGEEAVAAAEVRRRHGRRGSVPEREGAEIQRPGPAFAAVDELVPLRLGASPDVPSAEAAAPLWC